MSADIMPCGCEGHADNEHLCDYPRLARHRDDLMVELSQVKDERDYWRKKFEALEAQCQDEDEDQGLRCVKCRKRPRPQGFLFCDVCLEAM